MSRVTFINSIEFVFENCEFIEFDEKYIGRFSLDHITRSVRRIASNAIKDLTTANDVAIEIFSEGNEEYSCYGSTPAMKFERILRHNDITSIVVHYSDGFYEEFFVNYDEGEHDGKLGAPNIFQSTTLSNLGNLYIVISSDFSVTEMFDQSINDEVLMRHTKQLYGVFDNDSADTEDNTNE